MELDNRGNRLPPVKPGVSVYGHKNHEKKQVMQAKKELSETDINAKQPTINIEMITPARAEELLSYSTGNRKLRSTHVRYLTQQILDGRWILTHQAVAISVSGRLLDGHHRLNAIIRANKSARIIVMTGMPNESWEAIDCGLIRSATDRIAFPGETQSHKNRAAAIINNILRRTLEARRKPTNLELDSAIETYRDGLAFIMETWPKAVAPITFPNILAHLVEKFPKYPKQIKQLAKGLAGESDDQHGKQLRKRILKAYDQENDEHKVKGEWLQQVTVDAITDKLLSGK